MNFKITEPIFKQRTSISPGFSYLLSQPARPQNISATLQKPAVALATSFKLPSWQTLAAGAVAVVVAGLGLKFGLKKWRNVAALSEAIEMPAAGFLARKVKVLRKFAADPLGFKVENITSGFSEEFEKFHQTAEPSENKIAFMTNLAKPKNLEFIGPLRVKEISKIYKEYFDLFEKSNDAFVKYNNELGDFVKNGCRKYYSDYGDLTGFINNPAGQADEIIKLQRIVREHKPIIDIVEDKSAGKLPSLERSLILRKEILRQVADPENQQGLKLESKTYLQDAVKLAETRITKFGALDKNQIFKVPEPFTSDPHELHRNLLDENPPKLQTAASAIFGDLDVNEWMGTNMVYETWLEQRKFFDVFKYV